jgi:hypothetical protein
VDNYIAFDNVGPNQIGLRLVKPYPTFYQSDDGSIKFSITPATVTEPALGDPITLHATVDLAAATAATTIGSSSSLAFNAGVVFYRQRGNAGTNEAGLEPGTPLAPYPSGGTQSPSPGDASISPVGCFNGAVAFNSSYTGPQTIQAEFVVMVKPGAGAQTVGGANSNNATLSNGTCAVYFDNTAVSTLTGPTNNTFTWSATIPDDGHPHIIVFHINYNGPITAQWNVWLPLSAGGGVDATKIGMVGPT